jgi:hypothetical protein
VTNRVFPYDVGEISDDGKCLPKHVAGLCIFKLKRLHLMELMFPSGPTTLY